jgi:two-component system NtrC family sensor kinase
MRCPRCQHENRPQATFCEECAGPLNAASPTAQSYADLKTEVETLRQALTEAVEQQKAAAELVQTRNRELAEAHEQQMATAEVLQVISRSPTDLGPVFNAVAESAARLCGASDVGIYRRDGETLSLMAAYGTGGTPKLPLSRGVPSGRAVLDRGTVHVPDVETAADDFADTLRLRRRRVGAFLATPLLRRGEAVRTITIRRFEPGPFSDRQIRLLETFAEQAVIAIENVRLFNETKEALERETATSEILRVISSSPTDVQPVFAAVLRSAARLCDALDASIFQVEGDGLRLVAHGGPIPSHPVGEFPLIRGMTVGRAVLDRRTIHVPDVQAEVDEYPEASAFARSYGFRTTLSVPLLRGTEAIGAIGIRRTEVRPFTVKQVKLLETFAAQAVIAIENVRLFNETKEALEQQTATADILRVIASSPTDLQPVMEAVAESAARVCGATDSSIFRLDREHLRLVARHGPLRRALGCARVDSAQSIGSTASSFISRPITILAWKGAMRCSEPILCVRRVRGARRRERSIHGQSFTVRTTRAIARSTSPLGRGRDVSAIGPGSRCRC